MKKRKTHKEKMNSEIRKLKNENLSLKSEMNRFLEEEERSSYEKQKSCKSEKQKSCKSEKRIKRILSVAQNISMVFIVTFTYVFPNMEGKVQSNFLCISLMVIFICWTGLFVVMTYRRNGENDIKKTLYEIAKMGILPVVTMVATCIMCFIFMGDTVFKTSVIMDTALQISFILILATFFSVWFVVAFVILLIIYIVKKIICNIKKNSSCIHYIEFICKQRVKKNMKAERYMVGDEKE